MKSVELAPKDIARRNRCTVKYVYDLLAAGRIPGARKIANRWSIPVTALKDAGRLAKLGHPRNGSR